MNNLPKMEAVTSSNIKAIGYDKKEEKLYVEFKGKKETVWSYHPVSEKDFETFTQSPSLGGFFHQHIKTNPGIEAEQVV